MGSSPIRVIAAIKATSEVWSNVNPVLLDGELGYDLTENQFKMGNGMSAWNDLPFLNIVSPAFIALQDEIAMRINEIGENLALLRDYRFELHYTTGSGANSGLTANTYLRTVPGEGASGTLSGHKGSFPLQIPYKSELKGVLVLFDEVDFSASGEPPGNVSMDLEFRDHDRTSSTIVSRVRLSFGEFTGTSSTGFQSYSLKLNEGFEYISGESIIPEETLLGVRFIDSTGATRRVTRIRDPRITLIFEQFVDVEEEYGNGI